ncbi:histidine kinase dimerization/phosphoacceptor domain-containing protein [Kitasatospora sp. NPDC085879]|uniref:histidine kinase dimerization/phosphoacceptor domain-containing protein n=1 Tax=Kitasatospora sp. NPDC085879 TaxID=3154769 RepID=UPI00342D506D
MTIFLISSGVSAARSSVKDLLSWEEIPHRGAGSAGRRRWLSVAVGASALFLMVVGLPDTEAAVPPAEAGALAAAHAACLPVALRRPMVGWWLSLAMTAVTAWLLVTGTGRLYVVSLPWTAAGLLIEVGVLFLVGLGVRPRGAVAAWIVTVVFGAGLTVGLGSYIAIAQTERTASLRERMGTAAHSEFGFHLGWLHGNGMLLTILSGAALATGMALRGSGEPARLLPVQETATTSEHSLRVLLQERSTLARELHDVIAHHLTVIAVHAEAAAHRIEHTPGGTPETLAVIRRNA